MAGIIYVDQMFNRGTADTSLTAMAFGTGSTQGTYTPQLDGTLIKVGIFVTPQAATSLVQQGRVELSQTNWTPNTLRFPFAGFGLATVSQAAFGSGLLFEFVVNQPVKTSWPITGNDIFFFSPVTPNVIVYGYFSA
jgi:hypothetical protein